MEMIPLIYKALDLYTWVLLAYCIASFFPQLGKVTSILGYVVRPVLEPFEDLLRKLTKNNQVTAFSPMLVIFAIYGVQKLLLWVAYV
jgi:uncharacterized protein YggT (Ycf19 family)